MDSQHRVNATPELIQGPYYIPDAPMRRDVRDGVPGEELALSIRLVGSDNGEPLANLTVDIWQSDATGHYSGFDFDPDAQPEDVSFQPPQSTERFLRGRQIADSEGQVEFLTIFPGWYTSRSPHIHVKVFNDGICLLTTQLFFADGDASHIFSNSPDYARARPQDTFNGSDTVIAMVGKPVDGCWVEIDRSVAGQLRGEAIFAIDVTARSTPRDAPPGFRPPMGGISHQVPVR